MRLIEVSGRGKSVVPTPHVVGVGQGDHDHEPLQRKAHEWIFKRIKRRVLIRVRTY